MHMVYMGLNTLLSRWDRSYSIWTKSLFFKMGQVELHFHKTAKIDKSVSFTHLRTFPLHWIQIVLVCAFVFVQSRSPWWSPTKNRHDNSRNRQPKHVTVSYASTALLHTVAHAQTLTDTHAEHRCPQAPRRTCNRFKTELLVYEIKFVFVLGLMQEMRVAGRHLRLISLYSTKLYLWSETWTLKVLPPWLCPPAYPVTFKHNAQTPCSNTQWSRWPPPPIHPLLYVTHFPVYTGDTGEQPCHAPLLVSTGVENTVEWGRGVWMGEQG